MLTIDLLTVNYKISTLHEPEVAGVVVVGEPVVVVVVGEQVVWAGGVLGHDVPGVWGLAYKR